MAGPFRSFWFGGDLSPVEHLCLKSFIAHGHRFQLYAYEEVGNVPRGCELLDAATVVPRDQLFLYAHGDHAGTPAGFANLFRYTLLDRDGGWWVDTDVLCLRSKIAEPDHVFAMQEVLPKDERVDVGRAGVVGRSYGGYMTLTLAARHPELWRAAVDMFGPYDLFTFMERIPETWKPYFVLSLGDPVQDRDFILERSPRTHIENISCPLLVIQGRNDPRVVERESRDVVERLKELGRDVDYLVFEDEGHDVLKLPNRVRCYGAIAGFFSEQL